MLRVGEISCEITTKEGCNWGHGLSAAIKQNLCLAPDQKMVLPKKVANDLKINLAQ